ncbi:MAG TPA: PKD domain-containing protein, partial [Methanolinea sp.]|nr:PKD domain-containing protein [Methanolinea sp.]
QNPTHTYTNPGTYTVTLTVTNSCGNSATKSASITVSPCPPVTAQFSANVTTGYAPLTVQFTDLSTSGVPITSWLWNFGDGSTSTSKNPTHTYTNPGTYTVTLKAWNSCGNSATKSASITVSPCPPVTAQFSANVTTGYAPLTVQFTDLSTSGVPITSWLWNFGDGSTSTSQNPTHTYTNPGTYTVTLTVTNSCGNSHSMVWSSYITVMTPPPCGFISGTKYHDLNRNGRRDPGEPGLAGWTIQIFRKSGNNWIYVKSGITAADGTYTVTGLQYQPAEQYLVKEILQPGWIRTQPATEDYYNFIVLNPPHCYQADVDFGNWQ